MYSIYTGKLKSLALGLLLSFSLNSAHAQEAPPEISPELLEVARETVTVYRAAGGFTVVPNVAQRIRETLIRANPSAEASILEAVKLSEEKFGDQQDTIKNIVAVIWAQRFSMEELQQITTFYKSPVGQRLAVEAPGLIGDVYTSMDIFRRDLGDAMLADVRAILREEGIEF